MSDEKRTDVVFEFNLKEKFYAHRLILRVCAPALAEFCGGAEDVTSTIMGVTSVPITGVQPDTFRHLLHYVYGGTVPESELRVMV